MPTNYLDSATISTATALSSADVAALVVSNTILATTTVALAENVDFANSDTLATTTAVISVDRGPYDDGSVVGILTDVPVGEIDYLRPTGNWGPFDTANW